MIKIAVIGCGYWGPNYIRILSELNKHCIKYCCDLGEGNLEKIRRYYPCIKPVRDYKMIARDPDVDAAIIVTPLKSHYEITKFFLEHKKHVLVEKPFTSCLPEAAELKKIADKNKMILMVGHVYQYNPAVRKLRKLIRKGDLGSILYINAERFGLGPIRKQANVLWDLATHDISIALYLSDEFPAKVTALGGCYIQKHITDLVFISLVFPSGLIFNIYSSWIAPEKVRRITVVGTESSAVFDDVDKSRALKIYKNRIDKNLIHSTPEYSDHQSIVSIGDAYMPQIEKAEPLKAQVRHFLECIRMRKRPLTSADNGLKVIEILEAVEGSLMTERTVEWRKKC